MKRYSNSGQYSKSLMVKQKVGTTTYTDMPDSYSITDRIVSFTPTEYNIAITEYTPLIQFKQNHSIFVDFEINKDIGVFVQTIGEYIMKPSYVFDMLKIPKVKSYALIIYIIVLTEPSEAALEKLESECVFNGVSLMICWSYTEAGKYIASLKMYEKRGSEILRKNKISDIQSKTVDLLTSIEAINKDNANALIHKYKTVSDIMNADCDDLLAIPGMGISRVLNLYKAFNESKHP